MKKLPLKTELMLSVTYFLLNPKEKRERLAQALEEFILLQGRDWPLVKAAEAALAGGTLADLERAQLAAFAEKRAGDLFND